MYQLIMLQDLESSIWLEPGRKQGEAVWVKSKEAAQHLIEKGICSWPEGAPREVQQEVGPSERKQLGEQTDGPSTALPSSSESGPEPLSSASAGDLVLPHRL
jgi:hypothetical protein